MWLTGEGIHCVMKSLIKSNLSFKGIFWSVILIQFILTSIYYPLWEILSDLPMLFNNAAYHLYQMKLGRELAEQGRIIGYDPTFFGGYAGGFTINGSAKLVTLIAALLHPWASEVVVYKVYAYICDFLGPIFLLFALRILRFSNKEILIGIFLGLVLWWASWFRWSFSTGMGSSVLNMYISVFYMSLIIRYLEGDWGAKFPVLAGLLAAFLFFFHPHFILPVSLATALFLMFSWRTVNRQRALMVLTIIPILAILPNLPWLIVMEKYRIFSEPWNFQNVVDPSMIWKDALGLYGRLGGSGAKVYPVIWLGAIAAIIMAKDENDRRLLPTFFATGIGLILLARLGPALDFLKPAELNRFSAAGYLFLSLPASKGIVRLVAIAASETAGWIRQGARSCVAVMAILGVYGSYEVAREVSWMNIGKYGIHAPQIASLSDDKAWLLQWLMHNADQSGRVLFETSNLDRDKSLTSYFAYMSGLQFIGGPIPGRFRFSNPWDGLFFDKKIEDISSSQFEQYLDLFNVGWIIAHTEKAKMKLKSIPSVRLAGEFQDYAAYHVDRPRSYFYRGRGVVTKAGANELILDHLDGGEIVLKFHYVKGITTDVPVQINGVKLLDDPVPFIRILGTPTHLRISLP